VGLLNIELDGALANGQELQIGLGLTVGSTFTHWTPSLLSAPFGAPFVARIQNESGATPAQYIEATIAISETLAAMVTGAVEIPAAGSLWVRIVTAATAQNLRGTADYSESGLAGLADLKAFLGITATTHDALLALALLSASDRIRNHTRRHITGRTVLAERNWIGQTDFWALDDYPVQQVLEVRDSGGIVIDPSNYRIDGAGGALEGINGYPFLTDWTVDYVSGYASVPESLKGAAVMQAAHTFRLSQPGGNRLGDRGPAQAEAGSPGYVVDPWQPDVLEAIRPYVRLDP
jgi:uncharacterized phiE125 gp8 family phage protein